MREFLKKPLVLLGVLLLAILIIIGRRCCPPPPPGEGPRETLRENIVAPHAIAIIDANDAAAQNVQKARVTLIDPDGMVRSSNGIKFETVEVTDGVLSVGLSSQAKFSAEKPYRFFIRVEAEGYMSNLKTVLVTQNAPNYVPIYMVNLARMPRNGFAVTQAFLGNIDGGIVRKEQRMMTKLNYFGMSMPLSITIPAGTQLQFDGKSIDTSNDTLSYRMVMGNPLDSLGSRAFPGGFEVTDALNDKNEPFKLPNDRPVSPGNPAFFTSAGWFSLEMNMGNEKVNGFSQPVTIEMPVLPGVKNPLNGEFIKAGSKVPLWNMDLRRGVWRNEEMATVENAGNGQMKVVFKTTHFSIWNIDVSSSMCSGLIDLPYDNAAFSGLKWTRVLNRGTGAELKSGLVDYSAGSPLKIMNLPNTPEQIELVVHDGSDASFAVKGQSDAMTACTCVLTTPAVCSLKVFGVTAPVVKLKFTQTAAGGAPHPCNNALWYKGSCLTGGLYTLGGILDAAGEITIPSLANSNCIRLWFLDNTTTPFTPKTIDFTLNFNPPPGAPSGTLKVNGGPDINFSYTITTNGAGLRTVTISIPVSPSIPAMLWCS